MELYAFITRPEDFLEGDRDCLTLRTENEHAPDHWIYVQPVKVDFDSSAMDEGKLRMTAVEQLDREIEKAKMVYIQDLQEMQQRKERLMAITHQANRAGDDQ